MMYNVFWTKLFSKYVYIFLCDFNGFDTIIAMFEQCAQAQVKFIAYLRKC